MASTDHNAAALATSLGASRGTGDIPGGELVTSIGSQRGGADAAPGAQHVSVADPMIWYFKMRGIDGASSTYTTWVVRGEPDLGGALADRTNTTPVLVGSIVPGSVAVMTKWGGINPDGSG